MSTHTRSALWIATLVWVVGMATVFPLGNDALEAVSVFTFDRIAFGAAAGLFAVVVARHPILLRRWGRVEALMAVYLAVVLLSWMTTLSDKAAVDLKRDVNLLLTAFLMPYTAFIIGRHAEWTPAQVTSAYSVIVVVVGTYLVIVGFIQGIFDWSFLVAEANQDVHRSRARGPFDNAVPYAALLSVLVPIALSLYVHEARRWLRLVLIALCFGLLEMLVFARTRVVWAAMPLALLYFAAVSRPARKAALAGAGVFVAAVFLSIGGLDHRLLARSSGAALQPKGTASERVRDTESVYNRVAVYGTALNMIIHRPLFGFGFGARTFQAAREPYYASCCGVSPEWAIPCAVPHNEVLNVLVLVGAIGLLAYLGLLRTLWRLLSARAAGAGPREATRVTAVQAAGIALAIAGQMHDLMYLSAVQVLFFFLAGLAVPAVAPEDEGER